MEGTKPRQTLGAKAGCAAGTTGLQKPVPGVLSTGHTVDSAGRESGRRREGHLRQVKTEATEFSYTFQHFQDHPHSHSQPEGLRDFCAAPTASTAASHTPSASAISSSPSHFPQETSCKGPHTESLFCTLGKSGETP